MSEPILREPVPRPVDTNATPDELARYRTDYERGWRYSSTSPDPSLDHLDRKGARDAEYDGYMDAATTRPKWHLLHCPDHDNCGQLGAQKIPGYQGRPGSGIFCAGGDCLPCAAASSAMIRSARSIEYPPRSWLQ